MDERLDGWRHVALDRDWGRDRGPAGRRNQQTLQEIGTIFKIMQEAAARALDQAIKIQIVLKTPLTGGCLKAGKVHTREDIIDGLEQAPATFIGMPDGDNFGKCVIRVGPAQ